MRRVSPFGNKIVINARKDLAKKKKERLESGEFLQNAVKFNCDHYLNENYKTTTKILFDSLPLSGSYKQDERLIAFEIVIANLLYQRKKPIRISLNANNWTKTRYNQIGYTIIKDLIKTFSDTKLIIMEKGYKFEKDSKETRIFATKQLLDLFPEYNIGVASNPIELVVLKDSKGKLVDYKDTAETWRIRDVLKQVNEVNRKADIRLGRYKLNANLVAIFIERFTWYGRLHTRGYRHYQGIPSLERKEITINGDSTVELDFSGLHPNLLYADVGIQNEKDPYSIIDERSEVRLFLKIILLCMINSNDYNDAQRGANNWLLKHREILIQLKAIGITRAGPLMAKFIQEHKLIAHYLCSGNHTGMKLMNKDSKIALDVIIHFGKKGIPILSIHDSFIVQIQYRDELYEVMKNTYLKHTGFNIKVK